MPFSAPITERANAPLNQAVRVRPPKELSFQPSQQWADWLSCLIYCCHSGG
jgi:hypothetical protein